MSFESETAVTDPQSPAERPHSPDAEAPTVLRRECREGLECIAGFRLESLIAASSLPAENAEAAVRRRVAFARYVSNLDRDTTVEFRLSASRSDQNSRGRDVRMDVLFRKTIAKLDQRREFELRSAVVGFHDSLRAHFPEGEISSYASQVTLEGAIDDSTMKLEWEFGHSELRVPMHDGLPRPFTSVGFRHERQQLPASGDPVAPSLVIPWVAFTSDWRRIVELLHASPSRLMLRVLARPAPLAGSLAELELEEALRNAAGVRDSENIRRRLMERRNALFSSSLFLRVSLFGEAHVPREVAAVIAGELSGGAMTSSDPWSAGAGAIRFERAISPEDLAPPDGAVRLGGLASFNHDPGRRVAANSLRDLFTAEEAAGALRIPSPPSSHLDGFPIRHFRTNAASRGSMRPGPGSLFLGVNTHRGMETGIHLSLEERRRHVYIVGQTGTGKSTLLERMIVQDIRSGRGLAVFDPHGDLIENILCTMPADRSDDVILFDFADASRPIAFNPLVWSTLEERDFLIEELIASIIARLPADHVGTIFETYSRNFLKLLMGDSPRESFTPVFSDFPLLFQKSGFRKMLLASMSDRQVMDFVIEAESNSSDDHRLSSLAGYITSKFSRFIGSQAVIRTIGQPTNALDFGKVMNEGKIVLINLAKGRVGEISAGLLCSLLTARFRASAMGRGRIPIEERRDFGLYVDEFQNLASSSYSELLSEARKYRLGLVLANQFIAQLPNNVTRSIFGNVGSIFSFRVGVEDARLLADLFEPTFGARDLLELPNHHGYLSCRGVGEATRPFSIHCETDWPTRNRERGEAIRARSRSRWGSDPAIVDENLRQRRRLIDALD